MEPTRLDLCRSRLRILTVAGLLFLIAPSCRLFQSAVQAPGKLLSPGDKKPVQASVIQAEVMRFADRFDSGIVQATQDFAVQAGTTEARIQALEWSISARTAALSIASAPNPKVDLLDMIVLVTLGRRTHEEHWMPEVWHEADQPMVDAYRGLETDIWDIAAKFLEKKQLEDIRGMIQAWREENPEQASTTFVRLPRFDSLLASRREKDTNLFQDLGEMLSLDPLAGLEPAKREVAEARLLGERVLFYSQRAPLVFAAQGELLGLKLTNMPKVQDALEKSGQISQAAASLAETAAGLPEAIRAEREAAVRSVSDELTRQREGVVHDLEAAEAPVRSILGEVKETSAATREMSATVQAAIGTLDAFLLRLEKSSAADDGGEPGRPFDVREYGEAAARITEAAKELDGLLANVDRNEARTERLLDAVEERGDRSLDRATRRLVIGGLILIAAAAGAALAVRWISSRWTARPAEGRGVTPPEPRP